MIDGARKTKRSLRWGMVGGGRGSQIGYIHRSAALRDRYFDLVAGAFDIVAERGRDFGLVLGVDPARCYADYRAMFAAEGSHPNGIEVVTVATPNNTHYEISKAALQAGLHVVCEKPLTFTIAQAEEIEHLSKDKGLIVGVTYGYSGYQTIEEARALVASRALGEIRLVNLQFAHGFHSAPVEEENPAVKWRVDPKFAGPSYVLGDLATHPLYLSEVICPDLRIKRLLCARQSFVKSRAPLEDNAVVLMEYQSTAFGMLWTSAVNAGAMHGQKVRIVGEKASIEWWDEFPNQLRLEVQGEPSRILERGMGYLASSARENDRISGGHPEGLFESWSTLYERFARAIEAAGDGASEGVAGMRFPGVEAGVQGVRWVENCVRSANLGGAWVDYR